MIAQIENAILKRLETANVRGLLGYRLKTVASLGGEFDDEEALKKSVNVVPGMWVTFLGEEKEGAMGYGAHTMKATFRVIVAASSKRNQGAARHGHGEGAGREVGTYQMAMDARTLLAGQKLGLDIGYLEPIRIRTFPVVDKTMPGLSVMAVELATTYTATDAPNLDLAEIGADAPTGMGLAEALAVLAGATDFTTSHADWVAPFNLSDTVTLET